MIVFFGSYATGKNAGLYAAEFAPDAGTLSPPWHALCTPNPGFLAIAPNGERLYAVGRGLPGSPAEQGRVVAMACNPATRKITLLNELLTQGKGPCHLALHPAGGHLAVANYVSGSIELAKLRPDGALDRMSALVQHNGSSVDPERQTGPHAHSINFSPDGRFALAADLGLDRVLVYRFDEHQDGLVLMEQNSAAIPRGSGPRHLDFHPTGNSAFVVNEMAGSVTTLSYCAESGKLTPRNTVDALPDDYNGPRAAAEILVHPGGKYVYCSHRGRDAIAALALTEGGESVRYLEDVSSGGKWPRNFGIDPSGQWILAANQQSDNIAVLKIDQESGRLHATGHVIEVPAPVCVKFSRDA